MGSSVFRLCPKRDSYEFREQEHHKLLERVHAHTRQDCIDQGCRRLGSDSLPSDVQVVAFPPYEAVKVNPDGSEDQGLSGRYFDGSYEGALEVGRTKAFKPPWPFRVYQNGKMVFLEEYTVPDMEWDCERKCYVPTTRARAATEEDRAV